MKRIVYIVATVFAIALAFGALAHAEDPGADSLAEYMMGGKGMGGGMSGGGMGGHGMTGSGQRIINLIKKLLSVNDESDRKAASDREELRSRIQEKRQELASLLRSENPDKELVDRKIAELKRLEDEFDRKQTPFIVP